MRLLLLDLSPDASFSHFSSTTISPTSLPHFPRSEADRSPLSPPFEAPNSSKGRISHLDEPCFKTAHLLHHASNAIPPLGLTKSTSPFLRFPSFSHMKINLYVPHAWIWLPALVRPVSGCRRAWKLASSCMSRFRRPTTRSAAS